jgi:2-methylisocitrate lyase-like PEP mutase family enzyme
MPSQPHRDAPSRGPGTALQFGCPASTTDATGRPTGAGRGSRGGDVSSQAEKAAAFRALHAGASFVIPNPWDAGSARALAALGFQALASTSSGFAFTHGRLDGMVTLDDVVDHAATLVRATDLPVSVDLEDGYGPEPESAAAAIARVAEVGAVGASIEDYDRRGHIYDRGHATERIAAAVEAAARLGLPFTLTARAENLIRGNPDLDDTIARLQAFEAAGADVLYAPGLRTIDEIRVVCGAVSKPVNVLARPKLTMAQLTDAGATRVSLGGSLTWAAVDAMVSVATAIRDHGDFSGLRSSPPLRDWFA